MGMADHLTNADSQSWDDLKRDFEFTPEEQAEISTGTQRLIAEARAFRLSEVRRRQHTTQVEVAKAMGVTQARVSRIEKGQLERSEVDTLAAYVQALGGKLKIVADFGDESYVLG
jgi:predicted XRE-type DNA-binding protein